MTLSTIAKRVAALYWDPTDITSAEKEDVSEEVKNPNEDGGRPSLASRIATDYTLAVSIGKALRDKLFSGGGALYPSNYFALKDTHANEVKGFTGGYFSFGLEPQVWVNPPNPQTQKILASGSTLLMWGGYDPAGVVQSTRPADPQAPWSGNPEMAGEQIVVRVSAGYYNKLKGGGVADEFPIGKILVTLDAQENATVEILSPASFKANLDTAISQIQANPSTPKRAPKAPVKPVPVPVSSKGQDLPEYHSLDEFYDYIEGFGIEERGDFVFGPIDVNRLLFNLQKSNPGVSRKEIIDYLVGRGMTYNMDFRKVSSIASRVAAKWARLTRP